MTPLNSTEYFKKKLDSLNMPKAGAVTDATKIKIAQLEDYQRAVAEGRAFLEPDRSAWDVTKDTGLTLLKGAIGLPEAFVGLADIPTGGAVGKALEEGVEVGPFSLGFRPKETKATLDQYLSDAQKEANLRVQLAEGFKDTLLTAIENPSTIAATVGESAPSMLGGAAVARGLLKASLLKSSTVAGAVGEGVLGAGSAAEQIRQDTADGRLTFKQALSAVGSGLGTAAFGLAGGKLAQRLGVGDIDTALAAGTSKSPAGFMKNLATAGISEGVFEELPQSMQEQMWQNFALDKPIMEGVEKAGAMGLLAGFAMGQTVGTVSGLADAGAAGLEKAAKAVATKEAKAAVQKTAIETGDVSALVDPKNAAYDPSQAVSALAGNSAKADTTEEAKEANFTKASEIVADLEKAADAKRSQWQDSTPEGIKAAEAELAQAKAEGDTELADLLETSLASKRAANPEDVRVLEVESKRLDGMLEQAKANLTSFHEEMVAIRNQSADVASSVATVNAPIDETDTAAVTARSKAAESVINLSMAAPERVSAADAMSMADNQGNGLTAEQRQYLRAFSQAKEASVKLKSMGKVGEDILFGGPGFLGLTDHRSRVMSAAAAGNKAQAEKNLGVLKSFVADQVSKSRAAKAAWSQGPGTQIVRGLTPGTWAVATTPLTPAALKENRGLEVNSPKLVEGIDAGARAAATALSELQSAIDMKFSKPASAQPAAKPTQSTTTQKPQESKNVADTSKPLNPSQDATAANQEVQAEKPAAEPAAGGAVRSSDSGTEASVSKQPAVKQEVAAEKTVVEAEGSTQSKNESTQSADATTEEAASADLQPSSESSEKTSDTLTEEAQSTEEVSEDQGKLEVFSNGGATNAVATGMTQSGGKASDTTRRPLVAVKDFLGQLVERAQEFLGFEPSDGQQAVLKMYGEVASDLRSVFDGLLPELKAEYFRHENAMQYLLKRLDDGTVTVDENVYAAMIYAGFNHLASETRGAQLEDSAINAILGRDKKTRVGPKARALLGHVGDYQHVLADNLGGAILDALGLKSKLEAPQELEANLRAALGAFTARVFTEAGLLIRTVVPDTVMEVLRTGEEGGDPKALHTFYAIAREKNGKPVQEIRQIQEAVRGTEGVLDKLFKVASRKTMPSLEPITDVPANTKGTEMGVPDMLREVLLKNQSRPWKVRADMLNILGWFSDEQKQALFGMQPEEKHLVHKANRKGTEANNNSTWSKWLDFEEFVGNHLALSKDKLNTPFYFKFMPWKNQRVGIATTVGNPQTDKVARHLVHSPDWETEVTVGDNPTMNSFLLRVGEGLGFKTERQSNASAVEEIKELLEDQVYVLGVGALVKGLNGEEPSAEEKQHIVDAVDAGGEAMHSLDALVAYAEYKKAEAAMTQEEYESDKPLTFKTKLMGEVDGVANGTMLNHILLAAGNTTELLLERLQAGGFFTGESGETNYNLWRQKIGNLDIYETTARALYGDIQQMALNSGPEFVTKLSAIWSITGEIFNEKDQKVTKDGRNLIKGALNPLGFGAGTDKVLSTMSGAFLDSVYTGFEKISKKMVEASDADTKKILEERLEAYVKSINHLLEEHRSKELLREGKPIEFYMENVLSPQMEEALENAFSSTVGEAIKVTIESDFGAFISLRDQLNQNAGLTYGLYAAIHEGSRASFIEDLLKRGELKTTPNGRRINDLSRKHAGLLEKLLARVQPRVRTAMSKGDGKKARFNGLKVVNRKRKQMDAPEYESRVGFSSANKYGPKSTKVHGFTNQEEEPGVRMGSFMTHSFDSFISHMAQMGQHVLNIHDALGAGVGQLQDAAKALNAATWKGLVEFSPAEEVYESLSSVVTGLAKMLEDKSLSAHALIAVRAYVEQQTRTHNASIQDKKRRISPKDFLGIKLSALKASSVNTDRAKLNALIRLAFLDQYAFEGGQYEVTEADRELIQQKLDALDASLSQKELAALEVLSKLWEIEASSLGSVSVTEVAGLSEDEDSEESPVVDVATEEELDESDLAPWDDRLPAMSSNGPVRSSVFGDLGKPARVEPALVDFFKNNPEPSVRDTLAVLYKIVKAKGNGNVNLFQLELIKQLSKSIPKHVKVKLITKDSVAADALATPKKDSLGWFVSTGPDTAAIHVLSEDFVHSGLQTTETMLHEMVHAAVAVVIKNKQGDAAALVNELQALMGKAKAYAQESKQLETYVAAFENLDEFVAYGMTSHSFQRDVLNRITMKSTTSKNALVDGFKKFVKLLSNIIFRDSDKSSQARAVNGLTLMFKNVAGLLNAAEQGVTADSTWINLSQRVQAMTTQDVHDALDGTGLSAGFKRQLQSVLGTIVQELHGPFGAFKNILEQTQKTGGTPEDSWLQAVATGAAPLALSVQASPLKATEKELHVMEQVESAVRTALSRDDVSMRSAYQALEKLFTEMRSKISPADLPPGVHDFIFKMETGADNKSNHLARFAAFALAHEQFNGLMQQDTGVRIDRMMDQKGVLNRLQFIFEWVLSTLSDRITGTFQGQRADAKAYALLNQLVQMEAKKKTTIAKAAAAGPSLATRMDAGLASGINKVKDGLVSVAGSKYVPSPVRPYLQLGAVFARMSANNQVQYLVNNLVTLRDRHFPGLHGLPTQVLGQLKGAGRTINALQLMSTNSQRLRKHIITQTAKAAMASFEGGAAYFKDLDGFKKGSTRDMLSQVFLRPGLHVLLSRFNAGQLQQLMASEQALEDAIQTVQNELASQEDLRPFVEHYQNQANALAWFKLTGEVRHPVLMMNAHNIARLYGTAHRAKVTAAQAQAATPLINELVALYAIGYMNPADKLKAIEVMRRENARTDGGNGIEFVLRMHQRLERDSADRLFQNQEALMMHGHTPEIYNPGTLVKTVSESELADAQGEGYVLHGQVNTDPADPDKEKKYLVSLRDGGLGRFQTGVVSFSGMQTKGSVKHSGYLNANNQHGIENDSMNAEILAGKPGGLSRGKRPDLSKPGNTFMAPVVNPQGSIVNWRYMMQDSTKNAVLERDNRFDQIMGVLAGSIYDKESSYEVNNKTFAALRQLHKDSYHLNPKGFVTVGPRSTDPKLRELWDLLSDDSKDAARMHFGKDGITISKELLLPVFGFRSYSLADAFRKEPNARNFAEKFLVNYVEVGLRAWARVNATYRGFTMTPEEITRAARKAAVVVTRGEKVWQELVHEVKDIIVVKSIMVMVDNVLSNWSQLILSGVPIMDIMRSHLVAIRAASAYERDQEELDQLLLKQATGTVPNGVNADQEIARLKDAIARNPIKDLIDAGLMPTIVEDVAADDELNQYSYKSQLVRKVEGLTKGMPKGLITTVKTLYMAHDTPLYKGLTRVTRMSDFVARYTLYQHLINRNDNKLSKEEAFFEASEAFVNYDSPLPKPLQYLDQMGIIPFTKYYLRIQRVLLKMAKENPARVLSTLLLNNFVNLGPIVLESSWIHRFGNNPLHAGALQFPTTLDELATVAAALKLVK